FWLEGWLLGPLEQIPCIRQIPPHELIREVRADRRQNSLCFSAALCGMKRFGQAQSCAELPKFRVLPARAGERMTEARLRFIAASRCRGQQNFALYALGLRLPPPFPALYNLGDRLIGDAERALEFAHFRVGERQVRQIERALKVRASVAVRTQRAVHQLGTLFGTVAFD